METLIIISLIAVIVFCIHNLVFLLSFKPHKIEYDEEHPYPNPYQPPNPSKVKGKELPIIKEGDWVYDPNVNYRPRKSAPKRKLTRLT